MKKIVPIVFAIGIVAIVFSLNRDPGCENTFTGIIVEKNKFNREFLIGHGSRKATPEFTIRRYDGSNCRTNVSSTVFASYDVGEAFMR